MGGSSWSDKSYTNKVASKATRGVATFDHDADVKRGTAHGVHPDLNIKGKIREARDSAAHPESVPIGVIFDVTGSMQEVPAQMQKKLPELMGLLLRKGYVKDPQILFGAIGDTYSDSYPIQMGQFESGIEMDDNLTKVILEGNGGGQNRESYQNALYYFAHRTATDAWEKRGQKGYLFMTGDEHPYTASTRGELATHLGVTVESDVAVETIIAACKERWHVFFIIPKGTSHYAEPDLKADWQRLIGAENVLMLDDPNGICELIGLTIGLMEGAVIGESIPDVLKDVGASAKVAHAVSSALDPLAKSTALAKAGAASGALVESTGRSGANERL
jgi:hypothetical protein